MIEPEEIPEYIKEVEDRIWEAERKLANIITLTKVALFIVCLLMLGIMFSGCVTCAVDSSLFELDKRSPEQMEAVKGEALAIYRSPVQGTTVIHSEDNSEKSSSFFQDIWSSLVGILPELDFKLVLVKIKYSMEEGMQDQ